MNQHQLNQEIERFITERGASGFIPKGEKPPQRKKQNMPLEQPGHDLALRIRIAKAKLRLLKLKF